VKREEEGSTGGNDAVQHEQGEQKMSDIVRVLFRIIEERKARPSPESYTARLLAAGEDELVKKVGEEAVEVILAAKGQGDQRLIEEAADLLYHLLVLLAHRDITLEQLEAELERRRK
jgi:phosphoribosyl-ATP pyrophosphohydrolase